MISPKELNLFPAVVFIKKRKRIKDRVKKEQEYSFINLITVLFYSTVTEWNKPDL
jgi:hypothetical protein